MTQGLMYVGGEWVEALDGEVYDVLNPATAQPLAKVAKGGVPDVSRVVDSARDAFDRGVWPRMAPGERARVLLRMADMLDEQADEIARLETQKRLDLIWEGESVPDFACRLSSRPLKQREHSHAIACKAALNPDGNPRTARGI